MGKNTSNIRVTLDSMKVLIVYCHPYEKSYTREILEQLKSVLLQQQCSVEVSDLYAMNFQSDMTANEFEREGFSKTELPVPQDVATEHKKLQHADSVVFLYPVWWSDCPAKLKGWFDRVWTVGFAYKKKDNVGMKVLKHGVAVCTAGYTNEYLRETQIAQSMERVMLDDRFGNRFENKEMIILGGTLDLIVVKENHLEQIKAIARKIKA
jgi:NAD(P)H dehydrogenase (quinone)